MQSPGCTTRCVDGLASPACHALGQQFTGQETIVDAGRSSVSLHHQDDLHPPVFEMSPAMRLDLLAEASCLPSCVDWLPVEPHDLLVVCVAHASASSPMAAFLMRLSCLLMARMRLGFNGLLADCGPAQQVGTWDGHLILLQIQANAGGRWAQVCMGA